MPEAEQVSSRPFHETIVDAINGASSDWMACLAHLIMDTTIPKNHDAIIAAWITQAKRLPGNNDCYGRVHLYLLEQKWLASKRDT